jgi:AcrR family transcriptional regulator
VAGLRERKKQQTRETIVREAMRLFSKRGFEATTVAEIAEAAEIAPRTFFSYFETKEDVVFHDLEELLVRLREELEKREPGTTTFDALREWIARSLAIHDASGREELARRKLIGRTTALHAREAANRSRFESAIADSVAAELGLPADSLQPRMIGAAAISALIALGEMDADEPPENPMAAVDDVLTFLQGGLDALRA